ASADRAGQRSAGDRLWTTCPILWTGIPRRCEHCGGDDIAPGHGALTGPFAVHSCGRSFFVTEACQASLMNDLVHHEKLAGPAGERVLVRRSARRRRTVSITRREGDRVIAIPAAFSARQEREWAKKMVDQLGARESRRRRARRSDS